MKLPVLDIHTVGAGGGSVAWIDAGGGLRVGPRSAGADPGPVCFGAGDELSVTDANLLLGRLDPAFFLGGRMSLDVERTRDCAERFGERLGLGVEALAEGIVRIANANMERAVRVVSVQRGFDPRDFALLAFGGAGGLHACNLAESLEIATVLIPEHSGVLSALGMLLADVTKDYSASVLQAISDLDRGGLEQKLSTLKRRAEEDLLDEGFAAEAITLSASLAMRYKGQAYEIDVPVAGTGVDVDELQAEFHRRHAKLYGYSNRARATEAVQLRLRAVGRTDKPALRKVSKAEAKQLPLPYLTKETVFAGRSLRTPVYHRSELAPGMRGEGPAIVVTGESTNVIPPSWTWRIDAVGTLVAEREGVPDAY